MTVEEDPHICLRSGRKRSDDVFSRFDETLTCFAGRGPANDIPSALVQGVPRPD